MATLNLKETKSEVHDTEEHIQQVHNCSVCSTSFEDADSHIKHALQHVEEQAEECDVCHQCFVSEEVLKKHILQMHSTSGTDESKKYLCFDCGFFFDHKSHLEIHQLTSHKITEKSKTDMQRYLLYYIFVYGKPLVS